MNGIAFASVLIAAGSPIPVTPNDRPLGIVDRNQAEIFARIVYLLSRKIKDQSVVEDASDKDLIAGAIQGLHDEVGIPVPEPVSRAIQSANSADSLVELLAITRINLGNHPKLAGSRSMFAAINGFKHAIDPLSMLLSPRMNSYASIDQDFGVGIELEGATGLAWSIYQVENAIATGVSPPIAYFGPVPKSDAIPSPAALPWRVKHVVPGSPAQKGGVKPGDRILRINGVEINAANANIAFRNFAVQRFAFDPQTGRAVDSDRIILFQRNDEKPFEVTLKYGLYNPEAAFGVLRLNETKWDCMLDREAKIGYLRIGAIEPSLDDKVADMMAGLAKEKCRGLILDLRWCPGGYVDPGTRIAGMFLVDGSVIAKMKYRRAEAGNSGDFMVPPGSEKYLEIPLVVLVGQETIGGGELIASALRDNNRCVVIGQRTAGRASIQNTVEAGYAGLQYKLTTGISFRPNGKNRQRKPNSQPTDDWGVRPDEGLEVPLTLDKSRELRLQAELHSLRPADNRLALAFDDPYKDPCRLAALVYLRKKLAAEK